MSDASLPPLSNGRGELSASEAPLLSHLNELRSRLIRATIVVLALFVGLFMVSRPIFLWLIEPYRAISTDPSEIMLIYTAPQEMFFTQLSAAFFAALVVALPYLAWEAYGFAAPGLYRRERRALLPYMIATPVFFMIGAASVYSLILPLALGFFNAMQTDQIDMLVSVSEYLSFATTLILAFGICFQLPVVVALLANLGVVNLRMLRGGRRYAVVAVLGLAAFVSPPDPISQIGLAIPLYFLYELSIIATWWAEKRRNANKLA